MDVLDRAQDAMHRVLDEGRGRAERMRRHHERTRLLKELGLLCYDERKGGTASPEEIVRVVAEIDALEAEAAEAGLAAVETGDGPGIEAGA